MSAATIDFVVFLAIVMAGVGGSLALMGAAAGIIGYWLDGYKGIRLVIRSRR